MKKWFILGLCTVPVLVLACSSDKSSGAVDARSCAELPKCCEKLSEPAKSSCSASANGKAENVCNSFYDSFCKSGGGDGGADGGVGPRCKELAGRCEACANTQQKASCETFTDANLEEQCGSALDQNLFSATACAE